MYTRQSLMYWHVSHDEQIAVCIKKSGGSFDLLSFYDRQS